MTRRFLLAIGVAALAYGGLAQTASAQFYKGKTVTMIVNYPAGGPTDIEGRIIAKHLPNHIAGSPTIVVKNVGGAGGIIGSNQLGETAPNGETIGFFTPDTLAPLVGNANLRTRYEDFVMILGVENPLVVYARKDTPPGLKVATDIMKAQDFKALSLTAQSTNTINQSLCLDILGIKYQAIPAYRGLREVETAILQNIGQLANTSLPGWYGSVVPTMGDVVLPLWQVAPRAKDGSYPRSVALPDLQTFEEFYASVNGGKKPSGLTYEVLRTTSDPLVAMFRVAVLPPKTTGEPVQIMRAAFTELFKDKAFVDDYSKVVKTPPIMVSGTDAEAMIGELGKVRPEIKAYLTEYTGRLVNREK